MSSRSSRVRGIALAAAALAAAATLSACGPVKAGAAAIVGDQRISTATLDKAVTQWEHAYLANPTMYQKVQLVAPRSHPRSVLFMLVNFDLMDVAARRQGVTVTPTEVDAMVRKLGGAARVKRGVVGVGVPPQRYRQYARFEAQLGKVVSVITPPGTGQRKAQQQLQGVMQATAKSVKIQISPRYGSFDTNSLVIKAPHSSLSGTESAAEAGKA